MAEIGRLFLKKEFHIHLELLCFKTNCIGLIGKHGMFRIIIKLIVIGFCSSKYK